MANRWQIYKADGSVLGPWSALEVRDALRDGSIDPFDSVAPEGSDKKQQLVEVDELFLAADEEAKNRKDSVYDEPKFDTAATNSELTSFPIASGEITITASHIPKQTQRRVESPRKPSKDSQNASSATLKKHAKKYFLVDKKLRYHGPLSAPEIQALFYRGLVEQGSSVAKERNGARIPIHQFVTAYLGAKAKKHGREQTRIDMEALSGGLPSTKVMDQLARRAQYFEHITKRRSRFFPVLTLLFAVLLLFFILQRFVLTEVPIRRDQEAISRAETPESVTLTPDEIRKRAKIRKEQIPDIQQVPVGAPNGAANFDVNNAVEIKPRTPTKLPTKKKERKPKVTKRKNESVNRNYYRAPPIYQMPTRPQPLPATPVNNSIRSRVPAMTASSSLAAKDGQIITVSVRYATQGLKACQLKCSLAAKDASQNSIQLVFFSAQFAEQLNTKKGSATVTGRLSVAGSVYTIYLQSVR